MKLAEALQEVGGASAAPIAVAEALREAERERAARAIPVTVKSHKWAQCCKLNAFSYACMVQDGVKLAQALQEAGGASATPVAVAEALREHERERTARAIPVTVKSHMMGAMLQIKNPWVSPCHIEQPAR